MRKPKPEPDERPQLKPELARILEQRGPARYAEDTARLFAPGGKYSSQRKRARYAKT